MDYCVRGNFTVGGGEDITASGAHSTVGGGEGNTASGDYSTVGGGQGIIASGADSTVGGGEAIIASGDYSTVGGGEYITASGAHSTVGGGFQVLADKYGQHAFASGKFATQGDAQHSELLARRSTTNATPSVLFLDGVDDYCTIPVNTTWGFVIGVVARLTTADDESAFYYFIGCIDNNAGTTALVGSVAKTVVAEDTSAWDCAVTADDTNDALIITVTGEAAHTIYWVGHIELFEVTG